MNVGFIFTKEGKLISTVSIKADEADLATRGEVLKYGFMRLNPATNEIEMLEPRPDEYHNYVDGEWVLSEERLAELEKQKKDAERASLITRQDELEKEIRTLERFTERSVEEEAKLQTLIAESQEIYRYLNPPIEIPEDHEEMIDTEEVQE